MINKILVTSPRVTADSTVLMQAAKDLGQRALRLPSFHPTEELEKANIAVYGESLFAIILTTKLDHAIIEPTQDWLPMLPQKYSKRTVLKSTIGAARQYTQPQFVKNADGMKAFEAQIYKTGSDLPSSEYYPDEYEVLVSEPVNWVVEYRCFIRERELLTLSVYLRNGELAKSADGVWLGDVEEEAEARHFCQMLLQDEMVSIAPTCVIDIGFIEERGWAVVEANPAYGSGIYGCDPYQVLEVVNRTTLRSDEVSDIDRAWIVKYEVES